MPTDDARKPRELVLTLNTFASLSINSVKGKDGVVGVRVFAAVIRAVV